MRLGVYGDSYADDSHEIGWPTYISEGFESAKLRGVCGSSTPIAFLKFLEDYESLTHVVFSYTCTYRMPYLPEPCENMAWQITGEIDHHDKFWQPLMKAAQKSYNDMFYNKKLNEFLCNAIFREVNEICERRGIRLVNIIPFDGYGVGHDEYDMKYAKFPIIKKFDLLSAMESGDKDLYGNRLSANNVICKRPCHLNTPNNKIIADLIKKLWVNQSFSEINLADLSYVDISENEWNKWFPTVPYIRKKSS